MTLKLVSFSSSKKDLEPINRDFQWGPCCCGFVKKYLWFISCIFKGEDGVDTCKGDGGGPLFCPLVVDPERYVQIGIVAIGLECGLPNVPGIYASVPYGLCFIKWATHCKVS